MKATFLHHWLTINSPSYGNRHRLKMEVESDLACGDSSNTLLLTLHNHLGTHVDCPFHFDLKGKKLSDYCAQDWLFQNVQLLETPARASEILYAENILSQVSLETDLLLLRTGFERFRNEEIYWQSNPGVSVELAQALRAERPQLAALGLDFISLSSFQNRPLGRKAHQVLLNLEGPGRPIRIIEDMHLAHLEQRPRQVLVSPLPLEAADGAPVNVWASF